MDEFDLAEGSEELDEFSAAERSPPTLQASPPNPADGNVARASAVEPPADEFAAAEATPSTWDRVKKIPGQLWDDFKARPNFASTTTTEDEINSIAAKHGVDASELRKMVPLYGGKTEGDRDYLREAEGVISESALLGIPTAITRKLSPPKMEAALDDLNRLTEDKKSKAQFISEAVIPGVGNIAAKGGAGVALAAGVGATQGLTESEQGKEFESALTGGALGGSLGLVGEGVRRLTTKPAAVSRGTAVKSDGRALMERVAEASKGDAEGNRIFLDTLEKAPVVNKELQLPKANSELAEYAKARGVGQNDAVAHLEQETRELGRMLRSGKTTKADGSLPTLKESQDLIRDLKLSQGSEELSRRYKEYRDAKVAKDIFQDSLDSRIARRTGEKPIRAAWEQFIDGTHAVRAMDSRLGTPLERTMLELSQANNLYTKDLSKAIKGLDELDDAYRKANVTQDDFYKALDTGDLDALSTQGKAAALKFKEKFEEMADSLRQLGVPLQKMENYVPRQMVPMTDAILRVEQKIKQLPNGIDAFSDLDEAALTAARQSDPVLNDVVRGIETIQHSDIKTGRELLDESILAQNPTTAGARSEVTAGAAMQRLDRIPEFMLEKDPARLVASWASQNFKAARMQPGLSELRRIRNIADAAGAVDETRFIQTLITDLSGRRSNTIKANLQGVVDSKILDWKRLANDSTNANQKAFYTTLSETPEFLGGLYNQIYMNTMGLKPKAVVMNLLQPFMMTIPELGNRYGSLRVAQAYAEAAKGGFVSSIKRAEEGGFIPAQFSTELRESMRGGIRDTATFRLTEKALDKFAGVGMYLFEKSEAINRAVSFELGQVVAKDLVKGTPMAQSFLSSIPTEIRRGMQEAASQGNEKEVARQMTNYLINKTMFNYNKVHMSQLGRSLGPLFSTFTKWPLSIAGDVYTSYLRQGASKGSQDLLKRYFGPALASAALSTYFFGHTGIRTDKETGDESKIDLAMHKLIPAGEQSERQKVTERLLFGTGKGLARGAASGSPIQTLPSVLEGKIFASPLIQLGLQPAKAALSGDPKDVDAFKKNLMNTFVPVYGPMSKFWTETLPAIKTAAGLSTENPYDKDK